MSEYELDRLTNDHLITLMRCLEDIILPEATSITGEPKAPRWVKELFRATVTEWEDRGLPWRRLNDDEQQQSKGGAT